MNEHIELEHFIRQYTPTGWKESISTCCFVPCVDLRDYRLFKKAAGEGNLSEVIANYIEPLYKQFYNLEISRFNKWYFIEAIGQYFEVDSKEVKQ